jgi:hypothetical protein
MVLPETDIQDRNLFDWLRRDFTMVTSCIQGEGVGFYKLKWEFLMDGSQAFTRFRSVTGKSHWIKGDVH